ncbi:MFS transporter [Kitasatospora kifunensis]|uniref:MFS family permease n=1 Tax=Kitasatospora kifunensis TaxID=58351 RepID=A0A7W7VYL1_KITKI|nr:MFS transporter [Kitasatospora kifunensis]MBB4927163.1 MFS family permease [Kitasatospora kifunensis]
MRTYQELFRTPEFTPLFLTASGQSAAQTVAGLALGSQVYANTGSPLLTALAMFGPALAQVVGAATLLSATDRLPPRAALAGLPLLFALGTAVQALPALPGWAVVAVLLVQGVIASLGGGVRYGLLNELLPSAGYLLGRSMLNISAGVVQIGAFALGGLLVDTLSPRGTLLIGAALHLTASAVARFGLTRRAARADGRPSAGESWRTNARLWSAGPRRRVYLALWVPNGLIVGCESLYLPYAPRQAGLLFACGALGMLAGDTLAGRFVPPRWRERLDVPLCLLLAAPFLIFAFHPALPLAVAAVALATLGYASGLLLQERLLALTPPELAGPALGLHSSDMLALQGAGAALAGTLAELCSPGTAMALLAAASLAVTLVLAPGLRGPIPVMPGIIDEPSASFPDERNDGCPRPGAGQGQPSEFSRGST